MAKLITKNIPNYQLTTVAQLCKDENDRVNWDKVLFSLNIQQDNAFYDQIKKTLKKRYYSKVVNSAPKYTKISLDDAILEDPKIEKKKRESLRNQENYRKRAEQKAKSSKQQQPEPTIEPYFIYCPITIDNEESINLIQLNIKENTPITIQLFESEICYDFEIFDNYEQQQDW